MADSYPDVPSRRMAYHIDGTAVLTVGEDFYHTVWESPTTSFTDMSLGDKQDINDEDLATQIEEDNGAGVPGTLFVVLVFPELREIDGYYRNGNAVAGTGSLVLTLESSADTTNGIDGSWAAVGTEVFRNEQDQVETQPDYRDEITSAAVNAQRSIATMLSYNAAGANNGVVELVRHHIYGTISPGETPDRLLYVDELTGLEFSLPKDYGDRPRGSAIDYEWRLRNNSASLTANTVQITAEALFRGSDSWYTFDVGAGFAATRSIASIGNGADSALITTRQIIPDSGTVGLHAAYIKATTSSWS